MTGSPCKPRHVKSCVFPPRAAHSDPRRTNISSCYSVLLHITLSLTAIWPVQLRGFWPALLCSTQTGISPHPGCNRLILPQSVCMSAAFSARLWCGSVCGAHTPVNKRRKRPWKKIDLWRNKTPGVTGTRKNGKDLITRVKSSGVIVD